MPFGDGSDGNVVISVNTTLGRDMYYNNLTINTGVTLYPDGYVIYVADILTINGIINRNGINGIQMTGGAALPTRTLGGSGKGGNGYYATYENGESVNGVANSIGGGTYHGGVGGITDTYTEITMNNIGLLTSDPSNMKGGPGGGGGNSWASKPTSAAGGGSGAGVIYIEAQTILILSTGIITAKGGDHYSVYAGNSFSGGGGGGAIILYSDVLINDGDINVDAGSHSTLEDTTPWATSGIFYSVQASSLAPITGRPFRHTPGASIPGGIVCGMGKGR